MSIYACMFMLCLGQEFHAVFLSTTEPISEDGNTLNPTKSPCDRYVFNTVLTRAKSLVVVVGSPLVLLNTETHMVKLYGDKGRCWSLYLKSCLENGTFIIPSMEPDPSMSEKFKEEIALRVGAILPQQIQTVQSSRRNYKTVGVQPVKPAISRQRYEANSTASATGHNEAPQPKSKIRLVNMPISTNQTFAPEMPHAAHVTLVEHNISSKQRDVFQQRVHEHSQTQSFQGSSEAVHPQLTADSRHRGGGVTNEQTNLTKDLDPASKQIRVASSKKQARFSQPKIDRLSSTLPSDSELTHRQSANHPHKFKTTGMLILILPSIFIMTIYFS